MKASASHVAALLPRPAGGRWAVGLALVGGGSDKEYRIAVDGVRTLFQWGRRGAAGEVKIASHPSAEAAQKAALRQWASKEAKGYWPVTGIVPLTQGVPSTAYGVQSSLASCYAALVTAASSVRGGGETWLCQLPRASAPSGGAVRSLAHLPWHSTTPPAGSYCLVDLDPVAVPVVSGLCPIAVRIGEAGERSTQAMGEIAETLWREGEGGERLALEKALAMARVVVG